MSERLPEGALVTVELEVRIPLSATVDEVDEWLANAFRASGSIHMSNPLMHCEPEPFGSSFDWNPTGMIGRREEFDHQQTENGGQKYRVRYIREPQTTGES